MTNCGCQNQCYECQENSGMGFLPAVGAEVGSVAGPIGTIVGAIVGTIAMAFSFLGFGGDDQATDYRPPADSATKFVAFDDSQGNELVAYDATSNQSLAIGINNGNRVEDIFSYYSAFINNSVNAGASSAAAKVIMDVAAKYNVSISRAADMVLKVVGIIRTVKQIIAPSQAPRPPQQTPTPAPRPIPQPAPYIPQYPAGGGYAYQQPTQQTPQQSPQTQGGASGDSSGALLLGGGLLLFVLLARRRN